MTSTDLIAELRSARPVASDELRAAVRAIAARGAAERRTDRFAGFRLRRLGLVAVPTTAVAAVAAAGIVGLTRSNAPTMAVEAPAIEAARGAEGLTQDQATVPPVAKAPGGRAGGGVFESTPAPAGDRAQRYSAQLAIEVEDTTSLSEATQQALATTQELGGYVVTVSYAASDSGTATMTLRVPTPKVQDAIVRLSSLGTIVSQQVQIDDLQGQVDALAAREVSLRTRIARLSTRLASPDLDSATRATLLAQRDAARAELAGVRTTATQVDGEARNATIQLGLSTPEASLVPVAPSRIDGALDEAGQILGWEATVLLYAAVILVPPAALAVAIWLGLAAARRRSDERLLSAS